MERMCENEPLPEAGSAAVSLDCGDENETPTCESECLELSERGTRFISGSRFAIGTQLRLAVVHMHPRRGMCRMTLEGTVVWCEPCENSEPNGAPCFESTLLFLELPDELRPTLRQFSHRLTSR